MVAATAAVVSAKRPVILLMELQLKAGCPCNIGDMHCFAVNGPLCYDYDISPPEPTCDCTHGDTWCYSQNLPLCQEEHDRWALLNLNAL